MKTLIVPEVGMAFQSAKKAFDMYNTYAGQVGFSVRKGHSKLRGDGTLRQKYFVCNNQGHVQFAMPVFSLVLVERGFRQCKRLYLSTIITLLFQIKERS